MNKHRNWLFAVALAASLGLAGCWNDDDDEEVPVPPPPPPVVVTEVPDSAGISVAAFFSFLSGLTTNDESSEPLTIKGTFAVPADESGEPTPLT